VACVLDSGIFQGHDAERFESNSGASDMLYKIIKMPLRVEQPKMMRKFYLVKKRYGISA
jgi:hypothetical protein